MSTVGDALRVDRVKAVATQTQNFKELLHQKLLSNREYVPCQND